MNLFQKLLLTVMIITVNTPIIHAAAAAAAGASVRRDKLRAQLASRTISSPKTKAKAKKPQELSDAGLREELARKKAALAQAQSDLRNPALSRIKADLSATRTRDKAALAQAAAENASRREFEEEEGQLQQKAEHQRTLTGQLRKSEAKLAKIEEDLRAKRAEAAAQDERDKEITDLKKKIADLTSEPGTQSTAPAGSASERSAIFELARQAIVARNVTKLRPLLLKVTISETDKLMLFAAHHDRFEIIEQLTPSNFLEYACMVCNFEKIRYSVETLNQLPVQEYLAYPVSNNLDKDSKIIIPIIRYLSQYADLIDKEILNICLIRGDRKILDCCIELYNVTDQEKQTVLEALLTMIEDPEEFKDIIKRSQKMYPRKSPSELTANLNDCRLHIVTTIEHLKELNDCYAHIVGATDDSEDNESDFAKATTDRTTDRGDDNDMYEPGPAPSSPRSDDSKRELALMPAPTPGRGTPALVVRDQPIAAHILSDDVPLIVTIASHLNSFREDMPSRPGLSPADVQQLEKVMDLASNAMTHK